MTSQIKYNTKRCFTLLELYLYLIDGEEIDYESFKDMYGLSKNEYLLMINTIDEMTSDLHLECRLQHNKEKIITKETEYFSFKYKFEPASDHEFDASNLTDEKKIKYSAVIVYLRLKNKQKVTYDNLSKFFPKFTRDIFSVMITKFKDIFGEEIYKNEIQSYILDETE